MISLMKFLGGDKISRRKFLATPDHSYFPICIEAMKLGIHVYVEKPFVRTSYECELLMQAALNTDSKITIAATGIATAKALTPAMMLITECDFLEKRYLRAKSSVRRGMVYFLSSFSISLIYSSESSR